MLLVRVPFLLSFWNLYAQSTLGYEAAASPRLFKAPVYMRDNRLLKRPAFRAPKLAVVCGHALYRPSCSKKIISSATMPLP